MRRDIPKANSLGALIFAGVTSSLALVLTKEAWEEWNTARMKLHVQLPEEPIAEHQTLDGDKKAVANALKRIASAAQAQEGTNIGDLMLNPEDASIIASLSPDQKKILASVLIASVQAERPPLAHKDLPAQHQHESGPALGKRLTYTQAGASGIIGGVGFAIAGIGITELMDRIAGPASTWQKPNITLLAVPPKAPASAATHTNSTTNSTSVSNRIKTRQRRSMSIPDLLPHYKPIRRWVDEAISVTKDGAIALLSGGIFTSTLGALAAVTGGNPYSRTWTPVTVNTDPNEPQTNPPIVLKPTIGGASADTQDSSETPKAPSKPKGPGVKAAAAHRSLVLVDDAAGHHDKRDPTLQLASLVPQTIATLLTTLGAGSNLQNVVLGAVVGAGALHLMQKTWDNSLDAAVNQKTQQGKPQSNPSLAQRPSSGNSLASPKSPNAAPASGSRFSTNDGYGGTGRMSTPKKPTSYDDAEDDDEGGDFGNYSAPSRGRQTYRNYRRREDEGLLPPPPMEEFLDRVNWKVAKKEEETGIPEGGATEKQEVFTEALLFALGERASPSKCKEAIKELQGLAETEQLSYKEVEEFIEAIEMGERAAENVDGHYM
ncbi:hypothetical protein FRB99_005933 [Tulasnella sp. 403]|nr:hypothetical protein FRB99_005933 [Tulasnella sp. 403]